MIGTTAAILGSAVLGVGGSILSNKATTDAANKQADAIDQGSAAAIAEQRRQFDQTMATLGPRIRAGDLATQEMSDLMGLGAIGVAPAQSANQAQTSTQAQASGSFDPYSATLDQYGLRSAYAGLTANDKKYIASRGFDPNTPEGFWKFHVAEHGETRPLVSAPASVSMGGQAPATGDQPAAGDNIGNATPAQRQDAALSRFEASPGYRFRLQQGIDALDMSAARRGALLSGQEIKAVQSYGEGMAASEYGAYYDRLAGIADTGSQAATTSINVGTGTADRIAGTYTDNAASRASIYGAVGNSQVNMYDQIGKSIGYGLGYLS